MATFIGDYLLDIWDETVFKYVQKCLLYNKLQLPEDGTIVPKYVGVIKGYKLLWNFRKHNLISDLWNKR